ncbi:MAG: ABC transporter permease [Bacilli bacterium]|nr:ABC transporter permease [Bacilli bacterium]
MFKELFQYREFLATSVHKDIRGKYKGSFLGILWSFINPLLTTIIYTIIFSVLLKSTQEHYVVFVIIGVLPWTWFTNTMSMTNTYLINGGIIKKVYFPREILSISVVTSGLINFLISCIIILLFVIFSGIGLSWNILYLPLILIVQYVLQLGLFLIVSSVDVYVRDLEYIVNFLVQMLFYATPILYSIDMFGKWKWLLQLNPLTTIFGAYRDIFYYKTAPDFLALGIVFLVSCVILVIGTLVFKKLEKGFAEEV